MLLAYTEMGKIGTVAGSQKFCFGCVKLKRPMDNPVERSNSRLLDMESGAQKGG